MYKKILLRLSLVVLCAGLGANIYYIHVQRVPAQVPSVKISKKVFPVYLRIPSLDIQVPIEPTGIARDGTMEVSEKTDTVSWYNPGVRPGLRGNAVIAGHFDNMFGLPAVFYKLDKLKEGDQVIIENNDASQVYFKVTKSFSYNAKTHSKEVFGTTTATRLNLITCDGYWSPTTGTYTKRLVVFADVI